MNELGVKVAEDVLAQVQSFRLARGTYMSGSLQAPKEAIDLQEVADEVTRSCRVCLLGACVISKARVTDKVPLALIGQRGFDCGIRDQWWFSLDQRSATFVLQDVFSIRTIRMMECAFERNTDVADNSLVGRDADHVRAAAVFGLIYDTNTGCVEAIMKNIIANDGEFTLEPVDEDEYEERISWVG